MQENPVISETDRTAASAIALSVFYQRKSRYLLYGFLFCSHVLLLIEYSQNFVLTIKIECIIICFVTNSMISNNKQIFMLN